MRRILFLAYHFPPVGGAGVQRTVKFAKHLTEFGYEAVVVAGSATLEGRWTPSDPTLFDEVPSGTKVHHVSGPEPTPGRWRGRGERWLGLEMQWARWWIESAVAKGREVGGEVDAIYASMGPFESAEAAARLARKLGKPWIADLRDPWALDEMRVYPTALHHRRDLSRMRRLLASADAIVMNTREAAERARARFPELRAARMVSIPNGFDPGDFAGPPPRRDDEAFRIVHAGYLHTELGRRHRRTAVARRLLGGTNGRVDILTRSHVFLLEAIERLIAVDPSLASTIELHLAGVLSEADGGAARSPVVRMRGYLPHDESIALLRSADLLFLPMQELPPGRRASIVPGKTYEYLAAGRPILAAVPDGDARDLLAAAGAFLCRPSDGAGMAEVISAELERRRAGEPPRTPDPSVLPRYERRRLAGELAAVIDELLAGPASRVPLAAGSAATG